MQASGGNNRPVYTEQCEKFADPQQRNSLSKDRSCTLINDTELKRLMDKKEKIEQDRQKYIEQFGFAEIQKSELHQSILGLMDENLLKLRKKIKAHQTQNYKERQSLRTQSLANNKSFSIETLSLNVTCAPWSDGAARLPGTARDPPGTRPPNNKMTIWRAQAHSSGANALE